MRDYAVFAGALCAVIALSEAHIRVSHRVGWALLLACAVLRSLPRGADEAAPTPSTVVTLWLALLGVACRLAGYDRPSAAILALNVLACAVPPLHIDDRPLALLVLWLARLTPRDVTARRATATCGATLRS